MNMTKNKDIIIEPINLDLGDTPELKIDTPNIEELLLSLIENFDKLIEKRGLRDKKDKKTLKLLRNFDNLKRRVKG